MMTTFFQMGLPVKHIAFVLTLLAAPVSALDCPERQRAFIHDGGESCIPETPQRVISLHDQTITLSLLEVGAPVVGSMGRLDDAGETYMRAVDTLMGLDFDNSGIAYIGTWDAMDYEAMAALHPDLIVGRSYDMESAAKYEAIAPTVFIAQDAAEPLAFSRNVADAAGRLKAWQDALALYRTNLDLARFALPQVQGASYAKIQISSKGTLKVYAGYGGLTKVLHDLGFVRIEFAQEMADRGVAWGEDVSIELLPDMQADYIFDTYSIAYGDTFADPARKLEEALPGWCDRLTACAEGHYIVLPRELSTGYSFGQLNALLHLVTTNAARRSLVTQ